MRIKVKGLGPIAEGEVELGDLTVFFGPPNSGKSTLLRAIYYSLFPPVPGNVEGNSVDLGALRLEYSVEGNNYSFRLFPSTSYLKSLLPEGEVHAEPSFVKFVEENALFDRFEGKANLGTLFLPSGCEGVQAPKEVEYSVEVSGKSGRVGLRLSLDSVKPECRGPLLLELARTVMPDVGKRIVGKFMERFSEHLRGTEGFSEAVFIPYFRSLVTYELLTTGVTIGGGGRSSAAQIVSPHFLDLIFTLISLAGVVSKVKDLETYLVRLAGVKSINERVYGIVKPLIPGEVKALDSRLVYEEGGRAIPWNLVSASITEAMSLLLSVGENQLVLYEEPESQLYEGLQVLMALTLYALSSFNRLVITTHSQTILYTLAYVSFARPSAEEVKRLLDSLGVKGGEGLARAVEEANRSRVRFYYFHGGKIEEKRDEEIIDGIPGVVEIMRREFDWLSEVYWRRKLGAGNKG